MKKEVPLEDYDKPLTSKEFKSMNWKYGLDGLAEIVGEEFVAPLRLRGRPKKDTPKERVTLRLDKKIVTTLRANGKGWQTRLNKFLANAIEQGFVN